VQEHVLIIGCGQIGKRVATLLCKRDYKVTGTSRGDTVPAGWPEHCNHFSLDLDSSTYDLRNFSHTKAIFYFAPPQTQGEHDQRLQKFLTKLEPLKQLKKCVYISTTGVYGDCSGRWIDENEPLKPSNDRSRRRVSAEQQWRHWAGVHNCALSILRVSGIYAHNMLPIDRLKKGLSVLRQEDALPSNRIHADDLANICVRAMQVSTGEQIFNIADDQPSTMSDYFTQVAKRAGLPTPKVVDWQTAQTSMSPAMLSYLGESRRIRNNKIKQVLAIELQYANLDAGLDQCFPAPETKDKHLKE